MALRENRELPEKIANAPVLFFGSDLWLEAFYDLSSERQVGMALGPIPWSSVHLYGQVYGIAGEQLEDLHWYITRLDVEYIKYCTPGGSG